MGEFDVSKLMWVNYCNWYSLRGTYYYGGTFFITEKDIDNFIEDIFKEFSIKLNVSYEDAKNIIFSHNSEFYNLKKGLFEFYHSVSERHPDYINLVNVFKVPSISYLEKCLELFSYLSEEEKKLFLSKINLNH